MVVNIPAVAPPTAAAVRKWCDVAVASIDDEQLTHVLNAERVHQDEQCDVPEDTATPGNIPEWAYQALLRRCARELAARGIPMGVSAEGEFGPVGLPSFDGEISRIEGPYRKMAAG